MEHEDEKEDGDFKQRNRNLLWKNEKGEVFDKDTKFCTDIKFTNEEWMRGIVVGNED